MSSNQPQQHTLWALAKIIPDHCGDVNEEFIACKKNSQNPRDCVEQGKKVNDCVLTLSKAVNEKCADSFASFAQCLDENNLFYHKCRDAQEAFLNCSKGLN